MHLKVIFLGTANYSRSIMAEFLLRKMAGGLMSTWSVGFEAKDSPHPFATKVLREEFDVDASLARANGFQELPEMNFDVVITLCDRAREKLYSISIGPNQPAGQWQAQALHTHWSLPDPARYSIEDPICLEQFRETGRGLYHRFQHVLQGGQVQDELLSRLTLLGENVPRPGSTF